MGDREPSVDPAHDVVPKHSEPSRRRRWFTWRRLTVAALLVFGAGYYVIQRDQPVSADDGFVAFVPDSSLFPTAPIADADTTAGVGQPLGWPRNRVIGCNQQLSRLGEVGSSVAGTGWHTVRHDWTDGGDANAWIISEQTFGYEHAAEYEEDVRTFYDQIKFCGWVYDRSLFQGFTSILTDLDGLPDDAIAFTVGASPFNDDDLEVNDEWFGSAAEDFYGLGAFIPGPREGLGMSVLWVSWGADVPRDEFVAAVNTMYDAARTAPDRADDGTTIDFDFVEFDPGRAGILPIVGGVDEGAFSGSHPGSFCRRRFSDFEIWEDSAVSGYLFPTIESDARALSFGASRWSERSSYLDAKELAVHLAADMCFGSFQQPSVWVEPIDMPGLPEGAIASKWEAPDGGYAAVVFDDDKQTLMIINWIEREGPVPEQKFVEVVNRAWDQFQADNP